MAKWISDPEKGLVPVNDAAKYLQAKKDLQDGKITQDKFDALTAKKSADELKADVAERKRVAAEVKEREEQAAELYKATNKERGE